MDNNNSNLLNFINNNFNNPINFKEIELEIDEILKNIEDENKICSFAYLKSQNTTIVGINFYGNIDQNSLDFSFFVPNLFRQCLVKKKLPIPFMCPSFIINNRSINFIPYLIDKETIKSFLYFNYSTNIYKPRPNFRISPFILQKIAVILRTKRANNYGNYTNPIDILGFIYSPDSLLIQLLEFNKALETAEYNYNNNLNGSSYTIPWNFLVFCSCINNNFRINSENSLNKRTLTTLDLLFLNSIKNNKNVYKNYSNIKFKTKVENVIIANDIFVVLKYALEVYNDVIEEINYFMLSKLYCLKTYMRAYNIPKIEQLYSNYVINQTNIDDNNLNQHCSDLVIKGINNL